jgi:hypothetical protein
MTAEQKFYKAFKDAMPPWWHFQRIETTTDSGVPDVNLFIPAPEHNYIDCRCGMNMQWWIELKAQAVYLRPAQNAWIKKRMSMGCPVAIIARVGKTIKVWDSFFDVIPMRNGKLKILSDPNHTVSKIGELEKILT